MKDFIMGFAVFLILIFFPLQWTLNQINHYKIQSVSNIVTNAAQKARTDGYFKEYNINELKVKIADVLYVDQSEVTINVTTTPKYRFDQFEKREMIQYEIGIPIKKIIAIPGFFGISETENGFEYIIKGAVPSELLAP